MYLRSTKRKNKDGSLVEYFQLAHNERHPVTRKPVAKIIHSFGRVDKLDRDELVRLCRSIARVCDLKVTDPFAEEKPSKDIPYDHLTIHKTYSYGCVMAIEALWKRLGIEKTLKDLLKASQTTAPYERALFAMTANPLCKPESKLGVWDRWLPQVYLPSCNEIKLRQMYEALDFLHQYAEQVEEAIFYHVANLFNLEVDLIFYDTTTASFHTDLVEDPKEDSNASIRQYGHSKEGTWSPQIVIALAVTRDGLPVRSWVFPGNTSDVTTVQRIRTDLRGWNLGRAMFIADSGMNSAENRAELARACGKYLLACRMSNVAEIHQNVLSKRGRYTQFKDKLHAKEVIVGEGVRRKRYILCYNPKEAKRQRKHREELVGLLKEELEKHPRQDASSQWAIDLLASRRFKRYLRVTKGNQLRIDQSKIKERERYDGKWVLETNDDTISLEDAACGYKGLMVIERCFRSLKRTQIQIMPMYHWATRRIESHVKVCMLSLLIQRVAELETDMTWHQIKGGLDDLQVTKLFDLNHRVLIRNEPTKKLLNIIKKLKVTLPKKVLDVQKTS